MSYSFGRTLQQPLYDLHTSFHFQKCTLISNNFKYVTVYVDYFKYIENCIAAVRGK